MKLIAFTPQQENQLINIFATAGAPRRARCRRDERPGSDASVTLAREYITCNSPLT